jgi:5-methylcytosine-specific restriction endonuclease McrA
VPDCVRCGEAPRYLYRWTCEACLYEVEAERNRFSGLAAKWKRTGEWPEQPCTMCGQMTTGIDHIIPIVLGGGHERANLRPMCRPCNSRQLHPALSDAGQSSGPPPRASNRNKEA